ncbi:MAG: ankyrin repeat domain-containing protein, partial [Candidatus Babeliales bacterium]
MKKSYNCVMLALALVFTMVSASGMEPESLISAVKKNDVKQVQELLQKGADVNQADDTGFTLLYLAVCNDNRELCRLLLAHGADVNQANNGDYTPLQGAAVHGQVDIVALLLAHGAHIPNVEDIDESQEVETIQQAVEGIIDGTFKFYKEIDKSVLMLLCMAR